VSGVALRSGYELLDQVPSVEEYRHLREAAGLSPKSEAAAAAGLPNSWAAALVRTTDGTVVGMGRVIGDDGCFFQLGRPLYRRHGFRETAPDQLGMALVLGS
jgi:hypothetical protein